MTIDKILCRIAIALACGAAGIAIAKLPPPPAMTDEQKAKADEAKAKASDAAKAARALEEKYMDRAAERYKKEKGIAAAAKK